MLCKKQVSSEAEMEIFTLWPLRNETRGFQKGYRRDTSVKALLSRVFGSIIVLPKVIFSNLGIMLPP